MYANLYICFWCVAMREFLVKNLQDNTTKYINQSWNAEMEYEPKINWRCFKIDSSMAVFHFSFSYFGAVIEKKMA